MIKYKKKCCGCCACINACPVGAISLKIKDDFYYPSVNELLCINCKKCEMACPLGKRSEFKKYPRTIACQLKDKTELKKVSSGGVCNLIGKYIIDHGGSCFGCKFDESWMPIHARAENINEIEKFNGSKYVQSNIGDTYKECLTLLLEGKTVCFFGTPCQIAGLKSFLGRDYNNLFTVDFICHGVPSPLAWKRYVNRQICKFGKISLINFRDKTINWPKYSFFMVFDKAVKKEYYGSNEYMNHFLDDSSLRKSCYSCNFKISKFSDITVGDFWSINSLLPKFDPDLLGTSAIVFHTYKGEQLLSKLNEQLKYQEVKFYDLIIRNGAYIYSPTILSRLLNQKDIYIRHGLKYIIKIGNLIKKIIAFTYNGYSVLPILSEYITKRK